MRTLFLALGFVTATGAAVAACGDSEADETFCPAGEPVFCRCANGDPGSRDCNAEGSALGPCYAQAGGECPERDDDDDDTSSSSNPSSSGDPGGPGGGGPGSGGAGSGGAGSGELYAECTEDGDCASNRCAADGYCTKECATYEECDYPAGDCPGPSPGVPADAVQHCAPTCGVYDQTSSQPDPAACEAFGLYCGYATAVDGFSTLICGGWPDGVPLPASGTPCDDESWGNEQCNLGLGGAEVICYYDECVADACFEDFDCPQSQSCSSTSSNPGTCG
jgi:hypothetical protein